MFVRKINIIYIMETRKIYIVYSFGGEWEDKWERNECAFMTKEAAETYIKELEELSDKISDDKWEEIKDYLAEKEWEMQCKYYDPNTAQLYDDASEDDYYAECEEFEHVTKYELIKEKFNMDKDDYDRKEYEMDYDFVGYSISETELYLED